MQDESTGDVVALPATFAVQGRKGKNYAQITYFIQAEDGGPVKIGVTTRPGLAGRLASLQTGNPSRLVLRRWMRGNCEWELHRRFAHLRLVGEWFHADAELAKFARATESRKSPEMIFREGYAEGWWQAKNRFEGEARHDFEQAMKDVRSTMLVVLERVAVGIEHDMYPAAHKAALRRGTQHETEHEGLENAA